MEREVMLTGIGGQGVQLAAQIIARAAAIEGRAVMLFGVYSGMMRGGNTDSTVVVADERVDAPPLISRTWSALVMHHKFWEPVARRLRPDGVVVVNSSLFEAAIDRTAFRVFDVPATDMAAAMGNPMASSMIAAGAYAGVTGLVGLDSLVEGMHQSVPPYRRQHAPANAEALRAGFESVERMAAPAWSVVAS